LADQVIRRKRRSELGDRKAVGRSHAARRNALRLDGLPMLRTSERGTFKRCRWKWWQEFEEVLKPTTPVPPLRFGSLVHLALRDYYKKGVKRGPHPAKSFVKYYDAEIKAQGEFGFRVQDVEEDEVWAEAGELGEAMLNHYVEHWGRDDEWEVLVTEQPFRQLVSHPVTHKPWFWYVGVIDLIIRNRITGKLHIVDHKTAKAIMVQYLSLDSQATGYWTYGLDWIYANGLLKKDERPAGMIYNHLRKAFPDDRPKDDDGFALNKDGAVSKRQPSPFFTRTPIFRDFNERQEARVQVLAEFADIERLRAEGRQDNGSPPVQAYKSQGQWTCPGCWCFDFCELHEIGADWREMRELATKKWDPYAEHNTYADETH